MKKIKNLIKTSEGTLVDPVSGEEIDLDRFVTAKDWVSMTSEPSSVPSPDKPWQTLLLQVEDALAALAGQDLEAPWEAEVTPEQEIGDTSVTSNLTIFRMEETDEGWKLMPKPSIVASVTGDVEHKIHPVVLNNPSPNTDQLQELKETARTLEWFFVSLRKMAMSNTDIAPSLNLLQESILWIVNNPKASMLRWNSHQAESAFLEQIKAQIKDQQSVIATLLQSKMDWEIGNPIACKAARQEIATLHRALSNRLRKLPERHRMLILHCADEERRLKSLQGQVIKYRRDLRTLAASIRKYKKQEDSYILRDIRRAQADAEQKEPKPRDVSCPEVEGPKDHESQSEMNF